MPNFLKRSFDKIAGVAALGVLLGLAAPAQAQTADDNKDAPKKTPFILWRSDIVEVYGATASYKLEPGNKLGLVTPLHADSWRYGDNLVFADIDNTTWFFKTAPRLSFGKVSGHRIETGPIKDVLLAGMIEKPKGLPMHRLIGAGVDIAVPHFSYLQVNGYWRDDPALAGTTVQVSAAWEAPLTAGRTKMLTSGFIDVAGPEGAGAATILTQPQFWIDIGNYAGHPGKIYAGTEVQVWRNKFGVAGAHEVVPQIGMKVAF